MLLLGVYSFKHRPDPVIYEVDHLVTFEISPKLGMKSHRDGLERLSHMQLTSGVWTMRYLLSIDDREIVITEKASRKELESFPISHVHDPVNITSSDPKELYDDIIMFTVQGDMSRKLSEMHIFQSIGKPVCRFLLLNYLLFLLENMCFNLCFGIAKGSRVIK